MKKFICFLSAVCMLVNLAFALNTDFDNYTPNSEDYEYVDNFLLQNDSYYAKFSNDEKTLSVLYADRESGIYLYDYHVKGMVGLTAPLFYKYGDYAIRFQSNNSVPSIINGDKYGNFNEMYYEGLVPNQVFEFVCSINKGFNYKEAENDIFNIVSKIGKDFFNVSEMSQETTHITPYYVDYEEDFYLFEIAFDEFDYDCEMRYEIIDGLAFKYTGGDKVLYMIYNGEIGTAKDMYEKYKNNIYQFAWGYYCFYYDNVFSAGDINSDGVSDIVDVVLLRKAIIEKEIYDVYEVGDINYDDSVDIVDVVLLRSIIIYS